MGRRLALEAVEMMRLVPCTEPMDSQEHWQSKESQCRSALHSQVLEKLRSGWVQLLYQSVERLLML